MFDKDAFRELIRNRGIKIVALAAAMDMRPSTLYRKMAGKLDFTRSEIQKCCDFFQVDNLNHIFFAKEVSQTEHRRTQDE